MGTMNLDLDKIRAIADYQFGYGSGKTLFSNNIDITYSKKTGRIRYIYEDKVLLASLRPNNSLFTLTIAGAIRLIEKLEGFKYKVIISNEVVEVISQGKNVMAKHVVDASEEIRPGNEVIIVNESNEVQAVGKALMTRDEMLSFNRGLAVKVRRGKKRHR
jgi:7-cyano-7-deazaguanine tRNA-ribosyltransferase